VKHIFAHFVRLVHSRAVSPPVTFRGAFGKQDKVCRGHPMSEVGWVIVDAKEAGNDDTLRIEKTSLA